MLLKGQNRPAQLNESKIMKTIITCGAGLLLLAFLTGCVVTSVYPFYSAQDEVFDPSLVGTWSEHSGLADTNNFWRFARLQEQAYWLTHVENEETNCYVTHCFRLQQNTFLDLCTTNRFEDQLPLHYLVKIGKSGSKLQFEVLNFEWLAQLLEKNPEALRHLLVPSEPGKTNNNQLVITADTPELQRFTLKHINNTNAFGDATMLKHWKD